MSQPEPPGARRKRSVTIAAAVLVLTALLELSAGFGITARTKDPLFEFFPGKNYRYGLRASLDMAFAGFRAPAKPVRLLTDGRGFRVGPSDVDVESRYRMYVFGDELVFGEGLESHETFPAQFEKRYRDIYKEPYRVHNAGVPGYNLRLSLERLIGELETGREFDWYLAISDDDLNPVPADIEISAWAGPLRSNIARRLGLAASQFRARGAKRHETLDTLAPVISRLGKASETGGLKHPCVVALVTPSRLHQRIAHDIVLAGRCHRHDVWKILDNEYEVNFQPSRPQRLTADGAGLMSLHSLTALSASFHFRPKVVAPVENQPPGASEK